MISSTVTTPKAKKKVGRPRKVEEEDDEDVYVSLCITLHMYNQYASNTGKWLHPSPRRRLAVPRKLKRRMRKMCTFSLIQLCIPFSNIVCIWQGYGYTKV